MPEFRETTLSNGLRVAAEIDSRGYSAALGYFVQAGSRMKQINNQVSVIS